MKKTYKAFGIVILAAVFAACSGDSNSSTPNTAGGAVEDTNPIANGDSNNTTNWTNSDKLYIDSLLQTFGPPVYIDASNFPCDGNECPSSFSCEGDECLCFEGEDCPFATYHDSATTLPASPVEYGFETEREKLYDSLNTNGRSCFVEKYPLEDGARWFGTGNTIYNVKTVLIRKHEDSHFAHYMLDSEYGYATDQANCPIDSTAFADDCKKIDGILTSYTGGCSTNSANTSKLELICIAKIDFSITLDDLTEPFEGECKEFIANETTDWKIPLPTESVTCRSDPSMGGEFVCDTLEVYLNR